MNQPDGNDERERLMQILRDTTAKLCEHFEHVQIFASKLDDGGETVTGHTYGAGNYLARYGQIKEWIIEKDAYTAAKGRSDFESDMNGPDI